ncbi:MAG TPA: hypothetical protein PKH28_07925, partial [Candidatus Competibacteraceae bacterium]|nr:hypothetical protein [Candidatus Competibacteraceae bacterium]
PAFIFSPRRVHHGPQSVDRPVDVQNPAVMTYGVGIVETLIDPDKPCAAGGTYWPDYVPLLAEPLRFALLP